MVLISKADRKKVYSYLFNEGVMVVKKNPTLENHGELDVPNLHVMMLLRSLHSRNYVDEKFNWQWHYYFLNDEGIEFLRDQLHYPSSKVPVTMAKQRPAQKARDEKPRGGNWGASQWNKPEEA